MHSIQFTANRLLLWLNSCQTFEQLATCDQLIQNFIVNRFPDDGGCVRRLIVQNLQKELKRKFRLLREPVSPALAEEAEVYPRLFDYYITPGGRIVGFLKSVVA